MSLVHGFVTLVNSCKRWQSSSELDHGEHPELEKHTISVTVCCSSEHSPKLLELWETFFAKFIEHCRSLTFESLCISLDALMNKWMLSCFFHKKWNIFLFRINTKMHLSIHSWKTEIIIILITDKPLTYLPVFVSWIMHTYGYSLKVFPGLV